MPRTGRVDVGSEQIRLRRRRAAVPARRSTRACGARRSSTAAGLFKVVDASTRCAVDISNMTIVEGAPGVILIDPLISSEPARAALEPVFPARGERPVGAVIYTHSHVDHWGGVKGVVSRADVRPARSGSSRRRASSRSGQRECAAGNAMIRRAHTSRCRCCPRAPKRPGRRGLGKTISCGRRHPDRAHGDYRHDRREAGGRRRRDGVPNGARHRGAGRDDICSRCSRFSTSPNWLPQAAQPLTLRGAQVRDASEWSHYSNEAIERCRESGPGIDCTAPLAALGPGPGDRVLARTSATCTSTSTTRPCDWPTGLHHDRDRRAVELPPGLARQWTPAATTARSITTRRRCIRGISAGTTATRRISIRAARRDRPRNTSSTWAARRW